MSTLTHTWKGKSVSEAQFNAYAARAKALPPGSGPIATDDDPLADLGLTPEQRARFEAMFGGAAPRTQADASPKAKPAPAVPSHEALIEAKGLAWAKGRTSHTAESIEAMGRVLATGRPEIVEADGRGISHIVLFRVDTKGGQVVKAHNLYTPSN